MLKRLLPIFLLLLAVFSSFCFSQGIAGNETYRNSSSFDFGKNEVSLRLKDKENKRIGNYSYLPETEATGLSSGNSEQSTGLDLSGSFALKQKSSKSKKYLDIYFHNFYDSFQENYIANLIGHVHFGIGPDFFLGPYLDVYADSRSTKALIYNDRFVEIGFFMRYYLMKNLFFEGRIGYTRQIDLDSNKINFKPMLVYFNRFGDAKLKADKNSKTSLYLDIYYAAMYDYKYRNAFLQGMLQQVIRFHTKGYSYVENYLFESGQFDGRKVDYNNYFEVGTGIRFKPNVMDFPVIFLEPTYKIYFFGDRKNSFQIKAGFVFNIWKEI